MEGNQRTCFTPGKGRNRGPDSSQDGGAKDSWGTSGGGRGAAFIHQKESMGGYGNGVKGSPASCDSATMGRITKEGERMRTQSDSGHDHTHDGLSTTGRQALIGLVVVVLFAFGFFRVNLRAGLKASGGALLKFIDNPDFQEEVKGEEWFKEAEAPILIDFRLERERERSRLQERLEELFTTASEETAKEIHKELRELAEKTAMEHELENILRARGYHDVAVAIYPRSVTVVIKGGSLSDHTVSTVGRLVADLAQCPLEEIRIME